MCGNRNEDVGAERRQAEVVLKRIPADVCVGNGGDLLESTNREARQLRFGAHFGRLGLGRFGLGRLLLDLFGLDVFFGLGCDRSGRDALHAVLPDLAYACLLADSAAQVVELGAVDVADRTDLDLLDLGRVHGERPLDADAERLLAYGERLAHPSTLPLDHDSLEDLEAAPLALDHLEMHAHGVTRLELRNAVAQLRALEFLDDLAHTKRGRWPGGIVAGCSLHLAGRAAPPPTRLHQPDPLWRPIDGEDLADDVGPGHGPP